MKGLLVAVVIFTVIIALLIISYEAPARSKKKLSGRGGDFES